MKLKCMVLLLMICCTMQAQQTMGSFRMSSIPNELSWHNTPLDWKVTDGVLSITGDKASRLFVDPQRASRADSAPIALFKPDETFLFSCKISVDFASVFDAGVLTIYADSTQWAKLCFEYTPDLRPMIVSVVNDELSDDSNHSFIAGNEVYARIAGLGDGAYAFHYSLDGKYWHMARYFHLDQDTDFRIGFLSQSPRGEQCKSTFSDIQYAPKKLNNIRNGE